MSALVAAVVAAGAGWFLFRRTCGPEPDPRRELTAVAMHLARASRQGITPVDAMVESVSRTSGVVSAQLGEVCGRIERGQGFDSALQWWSREAMLRVRGGPDPGDVELLAVAARFAEGHGSGLAEVFEGVTAALVDRAELADEVGALTSQARASVAVLCFLPVVGLVLVSSIEPSIPATLVGTRFGLGCLIVAVALDATAVALSIRLTRWAVR